MPLCGNSAGHIKLTIFSVQPHDVSIIPRSYSDRIDALRQFCMSHQIGVFCRSVSRCVYYTINSRKKYSPLEKFLRFLSEGRRGVAPSTLTSRTKRTSRRRGPFCCIIRLCCRFPFRTRSRIPHPRPYPSASCASSYRTPRPRHSPRRPRHPRLRAFPSQRQR